MTDIKDLIIDKQEELIKTQVITISYFRKYSGEAERITRFMNAIKQLESELASLKAQIPHTTITDTDLENKLIDFTNWYLRLIKVTTDKDERHDIENREIVWSFLRGDDYKLWWNKWGASDTDYLSSCIKKATPNLSKIKDVDQELAEIRGGDEYCTCCNHRPECACHGKCRNCDKPINIYQTAHSELTTKKSKQ